MESFVYGNTSSNILLVQLVDDYDLSNMESEISYIKEKVRENFFMIAIKVDNWNNDLSPWSAPPVFGKDGFGGMSEKTLDTLINEILKPYIENKQIYLGGYSLSGLFALWSTYNTSVFSGVACASPSVWFPDFVTYCDNNSIKTKNVYLSLGNKEMKTKNPIMAKVGESIIKIKDNLSYINSFFEWNEGNHFTKPDERTAKGFVWLLNNSK